MNKYLFIVLLGLIGCSSKPIMTHGIPNLHTVSPGIYRGGQPTIEGFLWLSSVGVSNIVKLNTMEEGKDVNVTTNTTIYLIPLSIEQQLSLEKIHPNYVPTVLGLITVGTYIHCEHGQDRTGLICASYRWKREGWTKAKAEQEMLDYGFHKELIGLWETWKKE